MTEETLADTADSIAGKCVLVVEDDYVLAREVCNDLARHGAHILGPAPTVHYANLIIGKRQIDGAILDIKLFGEEVYPLVDALQARGVPMVLATAYQPDSIDVRYRSIETMHKPLDLEKLRRKVAAFQPRDDSIVVPVAAPPYASGARAQSPQASESRPTRERFARLMLQAMRAV